MKRKLRAALCGSIVTSLLISGTVMAAPSWSQLIPFKKSVEADPNKDYFLTEEDGPWLIMCRSFAGETAAEDARTLVLELRQNHKLNAYVHKQHYDFTKPEQGLGYNKFGRPKSMKPANAVDFDEIAVLVGNFQNVNDPAVADVLEKIKYAKPKCLEIQVGQGSTQRYAGLREMIRVINPDKNRNIKDKGPMRMAFVTRNPLLPEEFFAPKGLDPLVVDMNKHVEHSLLKNPGDFSVRIATFQGERSMKLSDAAAADSTLFKKSKLELGAIKAHQICEALREQGVEAWEFHDRHESIVTVGSFASVGEPRADGKLEINPAVHAIMERYKAKPVQLPGQAFSGMSPTKVANISLDVQPIPVAVPKQSFGQQYARGTRD